MTEEPALPPSASETVLDLPAVVAAIGRPDEQARAAQSEHAGTGSGSNDGAATRPRGRLDDLAAWLAAVHGHAPPRPVTRPRLILVAGDHGVADHGVSTRSPGSTARHVLATAEGSSALAQLAAALEVGVRVLAVSLADRVDELPDVVTVAAIRRGSGQVDREPAMTRAEAEAALAVGIALADEEADAGTDLLVVTDVGRGAGVPASALVGLLTRNDASLVTRVGGEIDDALWMRRCAAVREAMRRGRPVLGDYVELLATVGGADLAATTGVLLQSAARRTPVLLDGTVTAAAALVAQRIAFRSPDWWAAAHRSGDRAHDLALERLTLEPLLDLGIRQEDGTGALLAVPVVRAAAAGG